MTLRSDQAKLADLQKVLAITRTMAAAIDLNDLLALVIERSMELLDAERATLFLYDPARKELVSRIAAGADEIRIPADKGIAGAAAQQNRIINVPDAYADPRFNPDVDKRTGFRTRAILAIPLRDFEDQLVGVLQVLNKRQGAFEDYDIALAQTLAAQAGVAIQRANLIEHYVRKQQMERAMKLAREIQQNLLPRSAPTVEGFDIAGFCLPADETGGDTYDFLPLSDGRLMTVVADATGHGIGPALVIAETRAMLRSVSLRSQDAAVVLETVNNLLTADLDGGRFVTCFLGLLNPRQGSLSFASAGHGPLLFYSADDDCFEELPATGLPLGIMDQADFGPPLERRLRRGDLAIITTDGFFEAVNADGESFGIPRLCELIRRHRDQPAATLIETLHTAVKAFAAGEPQADDLTAVILRRI